VKRLIINADDFGKDEGVVRAIIDLDRVGTISSTSCLTNMPAWPQAAAHLRDGSRIGAGVHLVFNEGSPVLPAERVRALIGNDGQFLNDAQILRSLRPGTTAQLRAEFRAQIERFIADVGRLPDHLDSHCAISYARPDRFKVTLELAQEYGLPMRVPFGDDLEEQATFLARRNRIPYPMVRWLGAYFRRRIDRAGIGRPNAYLMHFSTNGNRTPEYLLSLLDSLREGWVSELLVHPGYGTDWREEDLRALLDPRISERLGQLDIELTTFAAVG
jgi:predicted glycoside hydrolase/deacetylase ChbG (UPF0249 family)